MRSPSPEGCVHVVRGGVVESRHRVGIAVADASGRTVAAVGDVDRLTFYRSAAKPFQALPLIEDGVVDAFGLADEEVALCCASHEGEPPHVDGARSILAKAGATEDLLRCGPHAPYSQEASRLLVERGESPGRIHNNCSGKHAGMIALAIARGWDPHDYHRLDHPVQRRMVEEVVRWSKVSADRIPLAVDGCGVVCFATPLRDMALSFASFAQAADRRGSAARIVDAMTTYPFMVAGTGRACTDVMIAAGDRVFVKLGAEGVYGGGIPAAGLGFAIKVEDGGRRAVEVALIRVLELLEVLDADEVRALAHHGQPRLENTRQEPVGQMRPAFDLPRSASIRS